MALVATGRVWAFGLAAALAAGLAGCNRPTSPKTDALATDRASAICASMETAAEVKNQVFQQAAKQTAASNRLALAQLAKFTMLRIEAPLLDSYDPDSKMTTCSGQVHVTLPAGAVKNLGDTSDLTASIKYSAEPTPDHLGSIYQVKGADDLISGIAGADITEWAAHLQPNGMPAEGAPVPAMAGAAQPPAAPATAPSMPPDLAQAVKHQPPAPPRDQTITKTTPEAEPPPIDQGQAFVRLPRCAWARRFADRTICGDPALEAEDRRIARLYRNAVAQDPTGEVRRVAQSERANREGCQDRECIVDWFKQREADLSRQ